MGVVLAGLVLTVGGMAVSTLGALRGELRSELRELGTRAGTLDVRLGALVRRMARIEGLIEGAGLDRPAAVPEPTGDKAAPLIQSAPGLSGRASAWSQLTQE